MERRLTPVKPATAGSVRLETLSWRSRVRAVISGSRRTPADEPPCEHNRQLTLCSLQKYFDSCASALEALRTHCDFSTFRLAASAQLAEPADLLYTWQPTQTPAGGCRSLVKFSTSRKAASRWTLSRHVKPCQTHLQPQP